jgi:hypothetical protein
MTHAATLYQPSHFTITIHCCIYLYYFFIIYNLTNTTYKLPEDGARVPKHVRTILYNIMLIICAFVGVIVHVSQRFFFEVMAIAVVY